MAVIGIEFVDASYAYPSNEKWNSVSVLESGWVAVTYPDGFKVFYPPNAIKRITSDPTTTLEV